MTDESTESPSTGVACLLARDLMFSSRVRAAANMVERKLLVADSVDRLISQFVDEPITLIMIDLDLIAGDVATAIDQLQSAFPSAKLIAYTGHVKEKLLNDARQTEKVTVITRGQFDQNSGKLMAEYC